MALITLILISLFPLDFSNNVRDRDSDKAEAKETKVLMESVFDRFHINYEMSRLHNFGYYQESIVRRQKVYYEAEGIIEIYIPSNLNQKVEALVSPIKTRKTEYSKLEQDKFLLGHAGEMARSSIWRSNSFLNERDRSRYQFKQVGDTIFKGRDSHIISFKPANKYGDTKGKLFIDKESHAIVHMEYSPIFDPRKSVWKSIKWIEDFEFRNGAFELTEVKFKGVSYDSYVYNSILRMNQVGVVSYIPKDKLFLPNNVSLFGDAQSIPSDEFWIGYDDLKPQYD